MRFKLKSRVVRVSFFAKPSAIFEIPVSVKAFPLISSLVRVLFLDNKSLIYFAPLSPIMLVLRLSSLIDELPFKPLTIFSGCYN